MMKLCVCIALLIFMPQDGANIYSWKRDSNPEQTLQARIDTPRGYKRIEAAPATFAAWLRHLPLKPGNPDVHLFNGNLKSRQDVHVAVVDIDVGTKDLQQCADAVIRMRAEYLYSKKDFQNLHFNFTNGFRFDYDKWRQGQRVKVEGNKTTWTTPAGAHANDGYPIFKKYLDMAFSYCGTLSLAKEMKPKSIADIAPGDIFIKGGSPGHAVLVLDVATNAQGKKIFLLGQSYMPAQEFHVLKNPNNARLSPWYEAEFQGQLLTAEWVFEKDELKKF